MLSWVLGAGTITGDFSSSEWVSRVSHPGDDAALNHRLRFRMAGITESTRSSRGFPSRKSSNFSPMFRLRMRKIMNIKEPTRMKPPITPSAINICSALGLGGGSRCSGIKAGGKETLPLPLPLPWAVSASGGRAEDVAFWQSVGPSGFR